MNGLYFYFSLDFGRRLEGVAMLVHSSLSSRRNSKLSFAMLAVILLTVICAMCAICASPLNSNFAFADETRTETPVTRLDGGGTQSADTANAIAKEAFPQGCSNVVIARDDDFADSMSGTGLAGTLDAPILLSGRGEISASTLETIKTLGATKAYIIGGNIAIYGDIEAQLEGIGISQHERVYGQNYWDTSVACANKITQLGGNPNSQAIVAMGINFQDALSISSFSYKYKMPIFLETDDFNGRNLTEDAQSEIVAITGQTNTIYVPGGNVAVPKSTVEAIFGESRVIRIAGNDGYDTSNQIATYMTTHGPSNNETYLNAAYATIANGEAPPKGTDALAGSALAGKNGSVMLLANANPTCSTTGKTNEITIVGTDSEGTDAFLTKNAKQVEGAYMLGGTTVMPEAFKTEVYNILNQWKTVSFFSSEGEIFATEKVWNKETVSAPKDTPEKEGYTFSGWYTAAGSEGSLYDFTKPVTTDTKLYAHWQKNTEFITVTFDAAGGECATTSVQVEKGSTITEQLPVATRSNYTFDGWYIGDVKVTSQTQFSENTTVVAKWTGVTYNITYELDGGTNATSNPSTYTYGTGVSAFEKPTKADYTFVGWFNEATFDNEVVSISEEQTGNVVLYAKWAKDVVTITFDPNGGTFANAADATKAIEKGGAINALPTVTYDDNHKFIGWYDGDNLVDAKTTFVENKTLTAKWTDLITITFDADGGTPETSSVKIEKGSAIGENIAAAPTKENYDFDAWYNDTTKVESTTTFSENTTVKAKWTPKTFNITYELDGGTNPTSNPKTYTYGTGTSLADATKDNYDFAGWYAENTFTNKVTEITATDSGNKTLYAKWTPKTYTITYELDSGTNATSNPKTYTYGTGVSSFAEATKTGYKFMGWYSDSEFKQSVSSISSTDTGNKTLYAKWAKNLTITFDCNGGTPATVASKTATAGIAIGDSFLPTVTKDSVSGTWYDENNNEITKDTVFTADTKLTAKYVGTEKYTITYNNQGHANGNFTAEVRSGAQAPTPTAAQIGTSTGIEFKGWYTDAMCSAANEWDFDTEITESKTLYARWAPAETTEKEPGDMDAYWLAAASETTTDNANNRSDDSYSNIDKMNTEYVSETWNVKRSSAEIKADVKAILKEIADGTATKEGSVTSQYKQYMADDNYHLYTKYNDTVTKDADKYMEFRIIEVGKHDQGDGTLGNEALTFQATHMLPNALNMVEGNTKVDKTINDFGWDKSMLRTNMNSASTIEGTKNIYDYFSSRLTSDVISVVNNTSGGYNHNELYASTDKYWLLSFEETAGSVSGSVMEGIYQIGEGKQYAYYSSFNTKIAMSQGNGTGTNTPNYALYRTTRSGSTYANNSTELFSMYWLRSPDYKSEHTFADVITNGYVGIESGMNTEGNKFCGICPCFAFGGTSS